MAKGQTAETNEVLIKFGSFPYYVEEAVVRGGEEVATLVEHNAFHNERVKLNDVDYERGLKLGAFWSEDEALAHYEAMGLSAPLLAQAPHRPPEATGESESGGDGEENQEVEITDLDEDDLVDWLMSTGPFDGNKKPTVAEVVAAGDEGDEEFKQSLLKAEDRASNGASREGVVKGLNG